MPEAWSFLTWCLAAPVPAMCVREKHLTGVAPWHRQLPGRGRRWQYHCTAPGERQVASEHCRALEKFLPLPQALAVAHLYVLHGLRSSGGLQQGHCATTKAATRHAAAINPGCR